MTTLPIPNPATLLEMAQREPDAKLIAEYIDVIVHLRLVKHFSYREIADWLTARGLDVDYNAVYRAFQKKQDTV